MVRQNAVTILYEIWMGEPEFLNLVPIYNIEATKEALLRGEKPVIWLNSYDEYIFKIADGRPMNIIKNLRLWFDDGESEIRINETNYKDFDSDYFYVTRKCIYDIEEEI